MRTPESRRLVRWWKHLFRSKFDASIQTWTMPRHVSFEVSLPSLYCLQLIVYYRIECFSLAYRNFLLVTRNQEHATEHIANKTTKKYSRKKCCVITCSSLETCTSNVVHDTQASGKKVSEKFVSIRAPTYKLHSRAVVPQAHTTSRTRASEV